MKNNTLDDYSNEGLKLIDAQLSALNLLKPIISSDVFKKLIGKILDSKGRVVFTGVGKSGHIGRKLASTMSSTGTPSFFVHASEASHGDLGMITSDDLVIALSYGGKGEEIENLIRYVKRRGIALAAITRSQESLLGSSADFYLEIPVDREACPLGLAPTTSSTATLVLGDALCVSLLKAKGFSDSDFAEFHPGGSLGRKLLIRVQDIMHSNNLPLVQQEVSALHVLKIMTNRGVRGVCGVTDEVGNLVGIITDGDLRRKVLNTDLFESAVVQAKDIMSSEPKLITENDLAEVALGLYERHGIQSLFVVKDQDSKVPIGLIHFQDLIKAKII